MSQKFDSAFDMGSVFGAGNTAVEGFFKTVDLFVSQTSGFASRSIEEAMTALERSATAGSTDEINAIQADYFKSMWKTSVEGATALNGLAADMTREVVGPIERAMKIRS